MTNPREPSADESHQFEDLIENLRVVEATYWTIMDGPEYDAADRADAAWHLDDAQTLMKNAIEAPITPEPRAEAEL